VEEEKQWPRSSEDGERTVSYSRLCQLIKDVMKC
jgi:hypothetical protein